MKGKCKHPLACTAIVALVGVLLLLLGVMVLGFFPRILHTIITEKIQLYTDSPIFESWREPPIPILSTIYIFNITNENDFLEGRAKARFQEIGPYVYRQKWIKTDLEWHDNGTVSYKQIKTFQFEPSLSQGSENDIIHTVNIPLLSAGQRFKTSNAMFKIMMGTTFNMLQESVIIKRKVREFLYQGYEDTLTKIASELLHVYPINRFGIFVQKNNSFDGVFTVFAKSTALGKFNAIDVWNGKHEIPMTNDESCNMINGTDGGFFAPYVDRHEKLYIFVPDLCRSIPIVYNYTEEVLETATYRYVISPELFADVDDYPENECYCMGSCLRGGVYNNSYCKYGAPVAVSFPHFLNADPYFAEAVEGLSPDPAKHSFYMNVEPFTGAVVRASAKFQVNVILERIPGIAHLDKVPEIMYPILWFAEEASMTEELVSKVRFAAHGPRVYGHVVAYSLIAIGATVTLGAILFFASLKKPPFLKTRKSRDIPELEETNKQQFSDRIEYTQRTKH